MEIPLDLYDLKPGVHHLRVSYWTPYAKKFGFGLPILTKDDGEIWSNEMEIEIR